MELIVFKPAWRWKLKGTSLKKKKDVIRQDRRNELRCTHTLQFSARTLFFFFYEIIGARGVDLFLFHHAWNKACKISQVSISDQQIN